MSVGSMGCYKPGRPLPGSSWCAGHWLSQPRPRHWGFYWGLQYWQGPAQCRTTVRETGGETGRWGETLCGGGGGGEGKEGEREKRKSERNSRVTGIIRRRGVS